jgi:DNA-binding NtrC family response regulator
VDDDAIMRRWLEALLARAFGDATILQATHGEEGLALLRERRVDLVLSDLHMPRMDGVAMLTHARSAAPSALRVLLTAEPDPGSAQRAINEGQVHAFFFKPVDAAALVATLQRLLAEQAAIQATQAAFARSLGLAAAATRDESPRRVPRVLVIDDVPEVASLFARFAERLPPGTLRVVTEKDPREARARLEREHFDAVLTDYSMPHVNGVDLLLHARRWQPEARRILVTGYNEIPETPERLRETALDACLHKPVSAPDAILLLQAAVSPDPRAMDAHRARARDFEANAGRGLG